MIKNSSFILGWHRQYSQQCAPRPKRVTLINNWRHISAQTAPKRGTFSGTNRPKTASKAVFQKIFVIFQTVLLQNAIKNNFQSFLVRPKNFLDGSSESFRKKIKIFFKIVKKFFDHSIIRYLGIFGEAKYMSVKFMHRKVAKLTKYPIAKWQNPSPYIRSLMEYRARTQGVNGPQERGAHEVVPGGAWHHQYQNRWCQLRDFEEKMDARHHQ